MINKSIHAGLLATYQKDPFPKIKIQILKQVVRAKSRKLSATWSLDRQESISISDDAVKMLNEIVKEIRS